MDSRAKELCQIGAKLFSKKSLWDSLCQDLADNFYPLRSDFTRTLELGDDFATGLMESYPVQARETLGNSINAMLRQGEWFAVKTGIEETDEDPSVARWLEAATNRFRRLVYDRRANFVAATIEADHDWVTFGNPVLSVGESPTRDHMLFNAWHPKDCAWMLNDVGRVDHLQRKLKMTARNLNRKYKGNAHSDIKNAAEKDPTKEFDCRHIVLPMEDLYGDDKAMRKKYARSPFLSLYVDIEHEMILGEGGLPVFSYVVPRWRTLSHILQGFSPATINAIPDGRMIQSMARIILEQGEKAVDPPTIGKGDIFRDAINLYAGGHTHVDLEDEDDLRKVFQTVEGGNLSVGMEMKQDVRELIAEAFLLNKLFLPDTREMTAYETSQRVAEFRRAALPFFGPIESEYHLPLLDAAFQLAIHNRQFNFDDMPEQLDGMETTFTFESPLNTAEGRANVAAFQESVQILAGSSQFDNTIPATMDFAKMTKDAVKGTGAPADWFKDEVEATEEADRQKQVDSLARAAAMLQTGASVGQQVGDAAQSLKAAGVPVA